MGTTLASAITQLEGFGAGNNIPTIALNPGSLELGDIGYGTITAANGQQITVFNSLSDGQAALNNQLDLATSGNSKYYSPDMSIADFGTIYSGGNSSYGNNLASLLGVDPSTPISAVNASGASTSSGGNSLTGALNDVFGPSIFGMTVGPSATGASFSTSRLIILILGVLLFAAGIFSFKQTQVVLSSAAGAVKKGAEVAVS